MSVIDMQRPIPALENVDLSVVPEHVKLLISELKQGIQARYSSYVPSLKPFDTLLFGIKQAIKEQSPEQESKYLFIDALHETLKEKLLTSIEDRLDYTVVRCTNPVLEQYFGVEGPTIDCSVLLALQSLLLVYLDLDSDPLKGLAKLVLDRLGYEQISDKDLEVHIRTLFDKADNDLDLCLALNKLSKAFSILNTIYQKISDPKQSSNKSALKYILRKIADTGLSGFTEALEHYIKAVYHKQDVEECEGLLFDTYGVVPIYYHPLILHYQSGNLTVRYAIVSKFILDIYNVLQVTFTTLSQVDPDCDLISTAKIFDSNTGYTSLSSKYKYDLLTHDAKTFVTVCSNIVLQYFAAIEVGPNITIADILASKSQALAHMHYSMPIYLYQDYLVHMFLSELLVPFVETVLMSIAKDIEPEQLIRETENTIKMFGPATLMIDDVVW